MIRVLKFNKIFYYEIAVHDFGDIYKNFSFKSLKDSAII